MPRWKLGAERWLAGPDCEGAVRSSRKPFLYFALPGSRKRHNFSQKRQRHLLGMPREQLKPPTHQVDWVANDQLPEWPPRVLSRLKTRAAEQQSSNRSAAHQWIVGAPRPVRTPRPQYSPEPASRPPPQMQHQGLRDCDFLAPAKV
jgi:hypothetical protein